MLLVFVPHTEDLPGPIPSQLFLRRARGYVPRPIWLAQSGPAVLGVGGELKTTFCLTRKNEAFVSQHIGDMRGKSCCHGFLPVIV